MAELDRWLQALTERRSQELLLVPDHPPATRRGRELTPLDPHPLPGETLEAELGALLDPVRHGALELRGDVTFMHHDGAQRRFRATVLRQAGGLAAMFRAIAAAPPTALDLDLPDVVLTRLIDGIAGLVLIAGPTGSGRTTTLAALVGHLNETRRHHLLVLGDPVEYLHAPVSCLISHCDVHGEWGAAIENAQRQDADVVVLDELAGAETIRLTLELAEAGTLVLASVSAGSAAAAIDHIVKSFDPADQDEHRQLLAANLGGVIAQQLIDRADGGGDRIAAYEVLVVTPEVRDAVRAGDHDALRKLVRSGAALGMQAMDTALERLVLQSAVTAQDALDHAHDKESFARVPAVAQELPELR